MSNPSDSHIHIGPPPPELPRVDQDTGTSRPIVTSSAVPPTNSIDYVSDSYFLNFDQFLIYLFFSLTAGILLLAFTLGFLPYKHPVASTIRRKIRYFLHSGIVSRSLMKAWVTVVVGPLIEFVRGRNYRKYKEEVNKNLQKENSKNHDSESSQYYYYYDSNISSDDPYYNYYSDYDRDSWRYAIPGKVSDSKFINKSLSSSHSDSSKSSSSTSTGSSSSSSASPSFSESHHYHESVMVEQDNFLNRRLDHIKKVASGGKHDNHNDSQKLKVRNTKTTKGNTNQNLRKNKTVTPSDNKESNYSSKTSTKESASSKSGPAKKKKTNLNIKKIKSKENLNVDKISDPLISKSTIGNWEDEHLKV